MPQNYEVVELIHLLSITEHQTEFELIMAFALYLVFVLLRLAT